MTYDEIKTAWDVQADEHNQWDSLSEDEKVEWAFSLALKYHPELVAWYVTGCSTMLDEHDAKAEAKRCGGSAKAVPLYTVPRGHAATQPAAQEMDTYKDRDTIFFLAGWNGCNEGLNAHEQFKKATIAAQANQGERP